jgi:hypothetical protein
VYTGYDGDLLACYAVTTQKVYAAGTTGIVVSTNAGVTWTLQNPVGGVINAMTFASPFHGIAIGNGGLVMVTYDGGDTWWRQPTPTEAGLYSIAFYNDNLGLIGGVDGTLLRTTNGGNAGVMQPGNRALLALSLHPNPASLQTEVSYELPKQEPVTVRIIDALGRTLLCLDDVRQGSGVQTVSLSVDNIPSGAYFVVVENASYAGTTILTISR